MSKGKILLFTTDFPPSVGGGIGTHSKFMAESLRKLGWEFVVLSEYYIASTQEEINAYSKTQGYPIFKLPSAPSFFSLIKKLFFCYRIYRKYRPDIIIGTGRHTTWFAAIISFVSRKPLVTIGHGTEFTQQTSKNDFTYNRWAYSRSSVIISISEFTKQVILKAGIKPKKIEVIHNPADENLFEIIDAESLSEFMDRKGIKGRKIILSVGALSERKGQKIIIRSLPLIKSHFPDVLFVAVGLPKKELKLEELVKKLDLENNVIFPGIVNDKELVLWYNACSIFSMASVYSEGDYEGYGIAVIEAALCGKASIVSDNAGLVEAVSNGVTGVVFPEKSSTSFAVIINELFANPAKLEKLSKQAHQNAIKNGTWNKKAGEYDMILLNVIKK